MALNATPVVREGYEIPVPQDGPWEELANSDATEYGGSGVGNLGRVEAEGGILRSTLPPLGALILVGPGRSAD